MGTDTADHPETPKGFPYSFVDVPGVMGPEGQYMEPEGDGPSLETIRARLEIFKKHAGEIKDDAAESDAEFTEDGSEDEVGEESEGDSADEEDASDGYEDSDEEDAEVDEEEEAGAGEAKVDPPAAPKPLVDDSIDPILRVAQDQLSSLRHQHAEALADAQKTAAGHETRAKRLDNLLNGERYAVQQYRHLLHRAQTQVVEVGEAKLQLEEECRVLRADKEEAERKSAGLEAAQRDKEEAERKLAMIRDAHDIEREMYVEKIKGLEKKAAGAKGAVRVKVENI